MKGRLTCSHHGLQINIDDRSLCEVCLELQRRPGRPSWSLPSHKAEADSTIAGTPSMVTIRPPSIAETRSGNVRQMACRTTRQRGAISSSVDTSVFASEARRGGAHSGWHGGALLSGRLSVQTAANCAQGASSLCSCFAAFCAHFLLIFCSKPATGFLLIVLKLPSKNARQHS